MLLGLLGLTNGITIDLRNSILKYSSSERATVSALTIDLRNSILKYSSSERATVSALFSNLFNN